LHGIETIIVGDPMTASGSDAIVRDPSAAKLHLSSPDGSRALAPGH
jgi:hypothetical protein